MHNDVATADGLVGAVVVDHGFYAVIFRPDLDAEGVRAAIPGPQHKFVGVPVVIQRAVEGTAALELGVGATLVDHQPIIRVRLEVEPTRLELEFGVAGRDRSALLVLGDKAEG